MIWDIGNGWWAFGGISMMLLWIGVVILIIWIAMKIAGGSGKESKSDALDIA